MDMTQKFTALVSSLGYSSFIHPCNRGVQPRKMNGIKSHCFS